MIDERITMTTAIGLTLPPIGGWKVTGQTPRVQIDPTTNTPVPGYQVAFITGYGTTGNVFVPSNYYSADTVKAAIAPLVAQLDAVSAMTHDS